jgi:hypothetical protein
MACREFWAVNRDSKKCWARSRGQTVGQVTRLISFQVGETSSRIHGAGTKRSLGDYRRSLVAGGREIEARNHSWDNSGAQRQHGILVRTARAL